MEFTVAEKKLLTKALGERAVTIMQDTGFASLNGSSDLSKLSPAELRQVMSGTIIGIGMAMADAQHMFERAAEVCREIVAREVGDPVAADQVAAGPTLTARRIDRATWPVVDRHTGRTYVTPVAAAISNNKTEKQIRISCYSGGRFAWASTKEAV